MGLFKDDVMPVLKWWGTLGDFYFYSVRNPDEFSEVEK